MRIAFEGVVTFEQVIAELHRLGVDGPSIEKIDAVDYGYSFQTNSHTGRSNGDLADRILTLNLPNEAAVTALRAQMSTGPPRPGRRPPRPPTAPPGPWASWAAPWPLWAGRRPPHGPADACPAAPDRPETALF